MNRALVNPNTMVDATKESLGVVCNSIRHVNQKRIICVVRVRKGIYIIKRWLANAKASEKIKKGIFFFLVSGYKFNIF